MPDTTLKMPVKIARLDFTDDGYPGFWADAWLNPLIGIARRVLELGAEDEAAAREFMLELFPRWNFVDIEGAPIPHTAEGFDLMPDELVTAMRTRRAQALREAAMPDPLGAGLSPPPNGVLMES